MDISISINSTSADVAVSGDLEQNSITDNFWVRDRAAQFKNVQTIKVFLDKIEQADTSGLAWLLNLKRDINLAGKECFLIEVPLKIVELAKLSGADEILMEGVSDDK